MKKITFLLAFLAFNILTSCSDDSASDNTTSRDITLKSNAASNITYDDALIYAKAYTNQIKALQNVLTADDFLNNETAAINKACQYVNTYAAATNQDLTTKLRVSGKINLADTSFELDEVYTKQQLDDTKISAAEKDFIWRAYTLANAENGPELVKLTDTYKVALKSNPDLASLSVYFAMIDVNRADFLTKGPCDKQIIRGMAIGGAKGMIKGAIVGGLRGTVIGLNPGTGAAGAVVGAVIGGVKGAIIGGMKGYAKCLLGL